MSNPRRSALVRHGGLALLALVWGSLLWVVDESFSKTMYPFTTDSSVYIEYARHLRDGRGFPVVHPWEPSRADDGPQLDGKFPPGYSLAIAAIASLGIDEPTAATVISRAATFLAPLALFLLFRRLVPERLLLALAFSAALSPGVIYVHFRGLADFPYLLLVIASIGLFATREGNRSAIAAGLLAGCSYWFRNVGISLLLALPAACAFMVVLSSNKQLWIRRGSLATLAALLAVVPLWLFNQSTFGTLQPYEMPPSTVSLLTNVTDYLKAQAIDIIGGNAFWRALAASVSHRSGIDLVPMAAVAALAAIFFLGLRAGPAGGSSDRPSLDGIAAERAVAAVALLLSYVALGAAVVVIARTRYEWGELITSRHAFQYSWAILVAGAILLRGFPRLLHGLVVPLLSISLAAKSFDVYSRVMADPVEFHLEVANDDDLLAMVRAAPEDALILSDAPTTLRIETARRAHLLDKKLAGCDDFTAALCRIFQQTSPQHVLLTIVRPDRIGECLENRSAALPLEDVEVILTSSSVIGRGAYDPLRGCPVQTRD